LREDRSAKEGIGGDRGLENDGLGIGLGHTVGVRPGKEGDRRTDGGGRNNAVRIQEIKAPVRENSVNQSMGPWEKERTETPAGMNWQHTSECGDRLFGPCTPVRVGKVSGRPGTMCERETDVFQTF